MTVQGQWGRLPKARRRRVWSVALTLALLAGAITAYVEWRGGWVNALNLPPALDASTPTAQNGFTLLAVEKNHAWEDRFGRTQQGFQWQDVSKDDSRDVIGLWIRPSVPPLSLQNSLQMDANLAGYGFTTSDQESRDFHRRDLISNRHFYQASAKTPDGDVVPLAWTIYYANNGNRPPVLLVTLPGGYSRACRFMDVTMTDMQGRTACWRVTDLPEMRQVITPPVAMTTAVTRSGITMTARAWREQVGPDQEIAYRLRPVLPANSHQWDVAVTGQWQEWEPYDYDGKNPYPYGRPIYGRGGVFNSGQEAWQGGGILEFAGPAPYTRSSRYLRVGCVLRQYETLDESVTFHDLRIKEFPDPGSEPPACFLSVTREQTQVTPSGIPVTLPVQGTANPQLPVSGALGVTLLLDTKYSPVQLPHSPLVNTFHRPVTVDVSFAPPFQNGGGMIEPDPKHDYSLDPDVVSLRPFRKAPLHAGPLPSLTVSLRQRVDIQTIPMTFTLPVAGTPPPFYPPGYRIRRQTRHS